MSLQKELEELRGLAKKELVQVTSLDELDKIRILYLGRKGKLTSLMKALSTLPPAERPQAGKIANKVRQDLEQRIIQKKEALQGEALKLTLEEGTVDITLPGKLPRRGGKHLISQIIEEIVDIFLYLGYEVAEGPEIELDYYNFEALNIPPDHPARSLMDTFYVLRSGEEKTPRDLGTSEEVLLRTHTSPVQVRVMEKTKPPIYVIAPGKAYRHDVADPTHSPMFHQVEGLVVDKGITFGDLKGTLETFIHEVFGKERKVRLRPHYFPFTEPSAEVDVSCGVCYGEGCRSCGGKGWLEIIGAGLVDPNVLEVVGYDPEEVTGFAFGMGIERIAMLKYDIIDIRTFFENDLRFLKQF